MDPTQYDQNGVYERQLTLFLSNFEWLSILDLDEFLYAREGTISSYLRSLPDDVGAVRLGWKMFGSNGHHKQPKSIAKSFIQRGPYENSTFKTIFRCHAVEHLDVHQSQIGKSFREVLPTQPPKAAENESGEAALQDLVLHLNHYQLQGREWFFAVKATRGSSVSRDEDNMRNKDYFESADLAYSGIEDMELKSKTLSQLKNRA